VEETDERGRKTRTTGARDNRRGIPQGSPIEERPDWPLPSFDAVDWAKAFCKLNPEMKDQEEIMVTWFANALMRGYDEHAARMNPRVLD
jgi:hypothetical protein